MKDINRKLTSNEMQIMDENSTGLGISKSQLMECAGYSAASMICEKYNLKNDDNVVVLCGTGNNGGDGFVIARHLASRHIFSEVILVGNPNDIKTLESKNNYEIISNLNLRIKMSLVNDSSSFRNMTQNLPISIKNSKIIIDCLLGTGIKGLIKEPIKSAIEFINALHKMDKKVVSIDVPSGMDPNDGMITDVSVICDLLITFHREKVGFKNAANKIPEIIVKDIGIPEESELFVGIGDLKQNLKKRDLFNHKGDHGKVLIIGGSENYAGAPALSAMAALEMDMDLVIVYAPKSVADTIRGFSPNLIVRTGKHKNINSDDELEIANLIEWADSIVIGPGMGLADETKVAVGNILKIIGEKNKPVVIDADAIKICVGFKDLLKKTRAVLTPHMGEFIALTGIQLPDQTEFKERAKILESVALNYGVTFLVKGKYDYISNAERTRINITGVPQMAVGGTGDILTGILASLLSLKVDKFDAACVAAFISGKLGEEYHNLDNFGKRVDSINLESNTIYHQTFKSSDLLQMIPRITNKYLI
jgi:hydroxyethylthiazole kinase-like uncharacterized protein yjeF